MTDCKYRAYAQHRAGKMSKMHANFHCGTVFSYQMCVSDVSNNVSYVVAVVAEVLEIRRGTIVITVKVYTTARIMSRLLNPVKLSIKADNTVQGH